MPYLSVNESLKSNTPPANIKLLLKTHMIVIEFLEVLTNKLQDELEKEESCAYRSGRLDLAKELTSVFTEYTEKAEALLTRETL